jgi:hypothetical protein
MPCSTFSSLASSTRSSAYFTVRITCPPILKSPNPSGTSLVRYYPETFVEGLRETSLSTENLLVEFRTRDPHNKKQQCYPPNRDATQPAVLKEWRKCVLCDYDRTSYMIYMKGNLLSLKSTKLFLRIMHFSMSEWIKMLRPFFQANTLTTLRSSFLYYSYKKDERAKRRNLLKSDALSPVT